MEVTGKREIKRDLEEIHVRFLDILLCFSKMKGSSPKKRQLLKKMIVVSREITAIKEELGRVKKEKPILCDHGFVVIKVISHSKQKICLLCGEEIFQ